jgi:hypothetical protein
VHERESEGGEKSEDGRKFHMNLHHYAYEESMRNIGAAGSSPRARTRAPEATRTEETRNEKERGD